MYQLIEDRLASTLSDAEETALRDHQKRAAILIPILDKANPRILLTVRASHLRAHAGQVAFPGGKTDLTDKTLIHTALRETHEEVGIEKQYVKLLGKLTSRPSRYGLTVQPYVGYVQPNATIAASDDEIETIFEVPLSFFRDTKPENTTEFKGKVYNSPSFHYDGQIIWGLTAAFVMDLVFRVF